MLKPYITRIVSFIVPKRYNKTNYYESIDNKFNDWIEKHHHTIPYLNVSESIFAKINGNLLKKQKNLLQISVQKLHNNLILRLLQGVDKMLIIIYTHR